MYELRTNKWPKIKLVDRRVTDPIDSSDTNTLEGPLEYLHTPGVNKTKNRSFEGMPNLANVRHPQIGTLRLPKLTQATYQN